MWWAAASSRCEHNYLYGTWAMRKAAPIMRLGTTVHNGLKWNNVKWALSIESSGANRRESNDAFPTTPVDLSQRHHKTRHKDAIVWLFQFYLRKVAIKYNKVFSLPKFVAELVICSALPRHHHVNLSLCAPIRKLIWPNVNDGKHESGSNVGQRSLLRICC